MHMETWSLPEAARQQGTCPCVLYDAKYCTAGCGKINISAVLQFEGPPVNNVSLATFPVHA